MKQKETERLLDALKGDASLKDIMEEHEGTFLEGSVASELAKIMEEKKIQRRQLVKNSILNEIYFYQILNGRKRPQRNKLICVTLAMGLNLEETQRLLKVTGYPELYARLPQDCVIIYGIEHGLTPEGINRLLFEQGLPLLDE